MPSSIQSFGGAPISTGDEVTCRYAGTSYPGEVTDIAEDDTPIITIYEDGIGTMSGWAYVDVTPPELQDSPDMSWCRRYPAR